MDDPDRPPLSLSTKQIKRADAEAAIVLLAELFPQAFAVFEQRRQPLKLGIHNDIIARIDGAITPRELGIALRFYCHNTGYLRAVARGAARVDLEGNPAGSTTAEQSAQAAAELKVRAERAARRQRPATAKRLALADLRHAGQLRASGVGRG